MKAKREDIETQEIYPLGNALDLVSSMAHFRAVHLLNNHGDELSKRFGNMADAIVTAMAWDLSKVSYLDPDKDWDPAELMYAVVERYEALYLKWRDAYNEERRKRDVR